MDFEQALEFLNCAFNNKIERPLTQVEIALVYGAWENLTYDRIAERSGYTVNYLQRDIGPKFWKLLSEALDRKVNKTTLRAILTNLENPLPHRLPTVKRAIDWGEAPDVSHFRGRQAEIEQLTRCITEQRCRLVAIAGQGGVGKSSLAAKVARQVAKEFDFVIWRSLRNAPPLESLLAELVPFVSCGQDMQAKPERLLRWLQAHRCLVILDNQETLLQAGKEGGYYQPQFANYGDLVQMVGEASHQSCVVLTSRERSTKVALLEDSQGAVRLLVLKGSWEASMALIEAKQLVGTEDEKRRLCELYRCNPLALKMLGTSIQSLFEGEIATFFATETPIFNGMRRLLDQQFERLSPLEQTLMYWLAINREWTALATLQSDLVPPIPLASLLEALESLTGRSLIEKRALKGKINSKAEYTQQPVVMEYVTDRLIQQLAEEIGQGEIACLNCYALTKTTVLDYIRESQVRVILTPLIKRLQDVFHQDTERLKQHLQSLLSTLRKASPLAGEYGAGNLINLCLHLDIDLTSYDFSHLTIRHAALQGATLQQVNFQAVRFVETTFTQTFAGGVWVGFNPDGQYFAVGDANASLHIWQLEPMQPLRAIKGNHNWVMAAAWHPDGKTLACSINQVIKLFNARTGQWIKDFEGEIPWAIDLAWSPDGKRLACTGKDVAYITVWDGEAGDQLIRLEESAQSDPTQWLMGLTWLADGALIAGAYLDHTIKIWDIVTGDCIQVIPAHDNWVASLAVHPNGRILASSGFDNTVKLWDWPTGECLATTTTLDYIWQLEWQEDGDRLAGASSNYTISIWDCSLQCLRLLQGHQSWVWGISWQRGSNLLISAAHDQVIKLWNTQTGGCIKTVKGYSNSSWCLRWNKDGTQLLSSSTNHTVQLWDSQTGHCLRVFRGHQNEALSVAWSPDENWIASSGTDAQIRIWNVQTGQCDYVLCGHTHWIRSIAWHPEGQYLISGSYDQTVKLWDAHLGECLLTLSDSQNQINAVAWLPDSKGVASASIDGNIRFWNLNTGICDRIISVGSPVHPIALSPDGKTLASGDYNNALMLWDVESGVRLQTFQVQTPGTMFSLSWSSAGHKIATASSDLTVRIWNVSTGECEQVIQGSNHGMAVVWHPHSDLLALAFLEQPIQLWDGQTQEIVKTLRCDRPYEGMNIAGVMGISEAQKAGLKVLGAIGA
ncbi:NB-ARC domain-containing protein [Nodosilinea sp. PGN35]|uniref:WD40 domain-containing protein n=1 Tax=Nodosilinea sp. PGN35 TaxID=3020489 RepID=UPI0023B2A519|nr:NB-ARC domain-containing protein [Nodosilinea sp. TSF1-S3]MDF0365318.1 NB-ARC domain-containing protein [Nodosilinea sp. TSF1-S3]